MDLNLQQARQSAIQQARSAQVSRQVFRLNLISSAQALDKRKGKGLGGGNTTYSRSVLNNDFIDNVRCRNLYTNTITFVNSSNAVNMGIGSLITSPSNQGYFGITIGRNAGQFSQQDYAIAIGNEAGRYSQGRDSIAIGCNAAYTNQGEKGIAIGAKSGVILQSSNAVAIGRNAGFFSQQINTVAIGADAGYSFQGAACVAIGAASGYENQGFIGLNQGGVACAIGNKAGAIRQAEYATSIGTEASYIDDGQSAVCVGYRAGAINTGDLVVNIGARCGENNQSTFGTCIGFGAGQYNQQIFANAIGFQAGNQQQEFGTLAIGNQAGFSNQGTSGGGGAIAIGNQAGAYNQEALGIAIGNKAGVTNQINTSTVINASNDIVNASNNGTYINPIRQANLGAALGVLHNAADYELLFYSNKTFVIDHPKLNDKLLVHACIEGPTADVYYRGIGKIDVSQTEILLPSYVKNLCYNDSFNIQISPIFDELIDTKIFDKNYTTSDIIDGEKFFVYGEPGEFSWIVHATREKFNVEPLKESVVVKGDGPYTYIEC